MKKVISIVLCLCILGSIMKEFHSTRVPTLLIGIGGIGGKIVSRVNKLLNNYDRRYAELMVLDTDIDDLGDWEEEGINIIQTSENMSAAPFRSGFNRNRWSM